jgi:lipopolysaccharide export system ATP-binding protein
MTHLSKKERWEKVEELLEEFSITHIRKSKGKVLSGGERRRTEIARLLTIDPKFVLLDEPFAGVDPIAVEEIQSLIFKLKNRNIGILITDHNVDETLSITDKAYLIFEGKLLQQGTPEDLVADERVKNLYLGSNFQLKRKNTV